MLLIQGFINTTNKTSFFTILFTQSKNETLQIDRTECNMQSKCNKVTRIFIYITDETASAASENTNNMFSHFFASKHTALT